LYALDRGHARIASFEVDADGDLSERSASDGELPEFTTGLAAY
jgi:6-phosphogluconolactonase (cycloisomerase 2 family)